MTTLSLPDFDSPQLYVGEAPHEAWDALRTEAGLHFTDRTSGPGFYNVVSYATTKAVLRDVTTFSSEWGMTLDTAMGERDPAAGLMIELTDKPKHTRLRKLVTAAITPQFVTEMELAIRAIAREVVGAALAEGDGVDVVAGLSGPMPRRTLGKILGIPKADQQRVTDLATQAITGAVATDRSARSHAERRRLSEEANTDLMLYFLEVAEGGPHLLEDASLVRRLMEVELDGSRLTPEELALNCLNLAIGGFETTKTVVAAGLARLASDPTHWSRLQREPELVASMVEEVLRFDTPALHLMRMVTAPVRVEDTDLLPGDIVAVWLAAANRDPAVFERPHEFLIDRDPNPQISFTVGPHFCLGSVLARIEISALFEELLAQLEAIEPAGPMARRPSNFIPGVESLALRVTRKKQPR